MNTVTGTIVRANGRGELTLNTEPPRRSLEIVIARTATKWKSSNLCEQTERRSMQ